MKPFRPTPTLSCAVVSCYCRPAGCESPLACLPSIAPSHAAFGSRNHPKPYITLSEEVLPAEDLTGRVVGPTHEYLIIPPYFSTKSHTRPHLWNAVDELMNYRFLYKVDASNAPQLSKEQARSSIFARFVAAMTTMKEGRRQTHPGY